MTIKRLYWKLKEKEFMAENITLARPYAKAIFEIAEKNNNFDKWSLMLNNLSLIVKDKEMAKMIPNYTLNPNDVAELIIDVAEKALDDFGKNLVKILALKRRLRILPDIASLFDEMRANAENTIQVECVSAVPLNDAEKKRFTSTLEKSLKKTVKMECSVEPSLMGGFVIRAGDKVIDGSIVGQLSQLKETMGG
jgi:F-type H+-transporting ATPase subunit delta